MKGLRLPKRRDFDDKLDYLHARQVYRLIHLAVEHGATLDEVWELLDADRGGFASWDFLKGGEP